LKSTSTPSKKPPAYGGHYSYDSTYVLTAAMQKAKSAKPKDIIKAMRTINGYAPVIGTMSWDDKGEQRYGAVGVYELRGGAIGNCACVQTAGNFGTFQISRAALSASLAVRCAL
jgi:ABC-type branched-subunit amino acid transport system substrate-binding protein